VACGVCCAVFDGAKKDNGPAFQRCYNGKTQQYVGNAWNAAKLKTGLSYLAA